jgi:hypothetical protein
MMQGQQNIKVLVHFFHVSQTEAVNYTYVVWWLLWDTVTFCVPRGTSPNCLHLPQDLRPSEYGYCKNSCVDAPKALTLISLLKFQHYLKCEYLRRDSPYKCFSSPELHVQDVSARVVCEITLENKFSPCQVCFTNYTPRIWTFVTLC